MPADAVAVHGLTAEFLADKPLFADVADEFLAFVGDAPVVAHNAGFDVGFINAELKRAAKPLIAPERIVDMLARRKHPGGHNTLDDLCSRYGVDRSRRTRAVARRRSYSPRSMSSWSASAKRRCSLPRSRWRRLTFRQSSGRGLSRCRRASPPMIATRTGR
jgi:hypothetical protein